MEEGVDDKRLRGLDYAKLGFTDIQFEEALKMIDSPDNSNQLLVALIDLSSRCATSNASSHQTTTNNKPTNLASSVSTSSMLMPPNDRESSPSCYSSHTSFASSSEQSLESLQQQQPQSIQLRKIYIDGCNVARTHAKDASFSWLGIKLCVDWFKARQHSVKVFVPSDKCQQQTTDTNEEIINYLNETDALVKTPSGCNDDLFIIEAARHNNGVIVSNDLYREEKRFNEELERFIHFNRLPYIFVDDLFIPANDPRGRSGPTLDEFLKSSSNEIGLYHSKVSRSKSHQRYQRNGFSSKFNSCRRSLQATSSLPIEQTNANNILTSDQGVTNLPVINGSLNFQQNNHCFQHHHHHHNHYKQQARRAISNAFPNQTSPASSREGDIQPQPPLIGRRHALCRTKSHNI